MSIPLYRQERGNPHASFLAAIWTDRLLGFRMVHLTTIGTAVANLTIATQQSDRELAQRRAHEDVERAVGALATNMLRIVRGAGMPQELVGMAADYCVAAKSYFDVKGFWPTSELHEMLDRGPDRECLSRMTQGNVDHHYAIQTIVRGSLQIAASEIAGQHTQERAGDSELHRGVRELEAALKKMSTEYIRPFSERMRDETPKKTNSKKPKK